MQHSAFVQLVTRFVRTSDNWDEVHLKHLKWQDENCVVQIMPFFVLAFFFQRSFTEATTRGLGHSQITRWCLAVWFILMTKTSVFAFVTSYSKRHIVIPSLLELGKSSYLSKVLVRQLCSGGCKKSVDLNDVQFSW